MGESFTNASGRAVVDAIVETIKENRAYLSEIDGAIGDGDHGINMSKGFSMAQERLEAAAGMSEAMKTVGRTLVMEIGGSMGPLYGGFFKAMAKASAAHETIDAAAVGEMLDAAYAEIRSLGDAKVGDKTLVDTLDPAISAYRSALDSGKSFAGALDEMTAAAERGKDSTKDLVARVGRSARLGERSKGVLDAGATSCWLILVAMAKTIKKVLTQSS